MNVRKTLALMLVLVFTLAFTCRAIRANEDDQATLLSFSQPIRVPGAVLTPGSYWFVLWRSHAITTNDLVEIFNADRTMLITTVQTIPAERTEAQEIGDTLLTFAEPRAESSQNPDALVKWFYPGDLEGHQFIYSPKRESQIDREEHVTINFPESSVARQSS
jgi:hypothetical protein